MTIYKTTRLLKLGVKQEIILQTLSLDWMLHNECASYQITRKPDLSSSVTPENVFTISNNELKNKLESIL